jgi:UTP--glucose-1-phosphate uridylyltransferase
MREELSKIVNGITDPAEQKRFQTEMSNFHELFTRYLNEKAKGQKLYR